MNDISLLNGLILIDKPKGCTSHDVVKRARTLLDFKNIGHAGTLDPLATGLLILLIGRATKLSDFVIEGEKEYWVRVQLGVETDTFDLDGTVVKKMSHFSVSHEKLSWAIEQLTGWIDLNVPLFSAVKKNGKKLYELARKQVYIEPPLRKMLFSKVEVLDYGNDWLEIKIRCGKGGYIRSWVQKLGELLEVGAAVQELRRLAIEPYHIHQANSLETLSKDKLSYLIPIGEVLPHWKSFKVSGRDERLMSHGQVSNDLAQRIHFWRRSEQLKEFGVKIHDFSGNLISLLTFQEGHSINVRCVFPYN